MRVDYRQFYNTNKYGWKTRRAEIVDETPRCVDCGVRGKRLEVHHVIPIKWKEDDKGKYVDVIDVRKEMISVKLEPLCHSCHMARDKGEDTLDIATLFVGGKL